VSGQFIAGWKWAWAAWLALYCWLWLHGSATGKPDAVADVLNCLTSFPLFWCFFVLDKPSVAVPGNPERNAAFRKAIGTTWGIGAGVAVLAVAGRLHLWGLNEFGLVFMGIYDGLAHRFPGRPFRQPLDEGPAVDARPPLRVCADPNDLRVLL
jgi:hypothetical protein